VGTRPRGTEIRVALVLNLVQNLVQNLVLTLANLKLESEAVGLAAGRVVFEELAGKDDSAVDRAADAAYHATAQAGGDLDSAAITAGNLAGELLSNDGVKVSGKALQESTQRVVMIVQVQDSPAQPNPNPNTNPN